MKEKDLKMTRGDTVLYAIDLRDSNGNTIEFNEDIMLYFTVKINTITNDMTFQKYTGNGIEYSDIDKKYHLVINPADTSNLNYGVYMYDITVKTDEDNFTVLKGKLTLDYEVTFVENEV